MLVSMCSFGFMAIGYTRYSENATSDPPILRVSLELTTVYVVSR